MSNPQITPITNCQLPIANCQLEGCVCDYNLNKGILVATQLLASKCV